MNLIFSFVGLAAMISAGVAVGVGEQFSANVLYKLAKENKGKSIVVSPMSVLFPLASLSLASVGESRDEIIKAIGMPNINVTQEVLSNVVKNLRSVRGVEMKLANIIYIAQDAELNQEFAESSKTALDLDYKKINFSGAAQAVNEINHWVKKQTNNRIKNLLSESDVNAATQAVIINAIYFQGKWVNQFRANKTKIENFYTSKHKSVQLLMMAGTFNLQYAENNELDAKILEMPYQRHEASFLIVLPNRIDGISNLHEKLRNASVLSKAITELQQSKVHVSLPKFNIETTTRLNGILNKVGIKQLFTKKVNLQNLLQNKSHFSISNIIQKALIEVNEDGATAAAATSINLASSSPFSPKLEERSFVADHPFVFYLRVHENVLFSGVLQP